MTDSDKQLIKDYAQLFTLQSISSESPEGYCLSISMALSLYLNSLGIPTEIIAGYMNGSGHFWIQLLDYKSYTILDATIKQFDPSQDAIYIGDKNGNEITCQYIEVSQDWALTFSMWSIPTHYLEMPRPQDQVEKFVLHNLINASILCFEIEKLENNLKQHTKESDLFSNYYKTIFDWLKDDSIVSPQISNALKSKVGKEYDFLLSQVNP